MNAEQRAARYRQLPQPRLDAIRYRKILAGMGGSDLELLAEIARRGELADQALCRMDSKGESLEAAAEAVTGGNVIDDAAIAFILRGGR